MGYFWLNSNSKWRATLSPQFETLTKGCAQVEVDWYMAENEMFIFLDFFLHVSSDAFSGQCSIHHHESSEQRAPMQGGWFKSWQRHDSDLFSKSLFLQNLLEMLAFNTNADQMRWQASLWLPLILSFTEPVMCFITYSQLNTMLCCCSV